MELASRDQAIVQRLLIVTTLLGIHNTQTPDIKAAASRSKKRH